MNSAQKAFTLHLFTGLIVGVLFFVLWPINKDALFWAIIGLSLGSRVTRRYSKFTGALLGAFVGLGLYGLLLLLDKLILLSP